MGKTIFDQYTLLHFGVGIVVYFWNFTFLGWLILHTLFEIIENTQIGMYVINRYITWWPGGKDYADAPINSLVGDNIGAILGWLLAYVVAKN